jgi:ABC-type branched-subunit amino acid transport system substrate-binding protein
MNRRYLALAVVGLAPFMAACNSAKGESKSSGAVKLMVVASVGTTLQNYPDVKAGAEAAVKSINAAGGISGKQIDLQFCNANSDPNAALACARKAVSDKVAAVVGYTDTFSSSALPVLEQAKIPAVGLMPRGNAVELNSAASFPFEGGSAGDSLAAPFGLKAAGGKAVVAVSADVPSAIANAGLVEKGAAKAGIKYAGVVKIPTTGVTDYAPYAQQIKALGGDSVMFNATVAQIQGVMKASKALGLKVTFMQHGTAFGVKEIAATGDIAEGLMLVSGYPAYSDTSNAGIAKYNADMAANGTNDASLKRPGSINAWLAVYAVKDVAEGKGGTPAITGAITSTSLMAAMKDAKDVDLEGLAKWTPMGTGPAEMPRVAHSTVNFLLVKGGQVTATTIAPVDIVAALA